MIVDPKTGVLLEVVQQRDGGKAGRQTCLSVGPTDKSG